MTKYEQYMKICVYRWEMWEDYLASKDRDEVNPSVQNAYTSFAYALDDEMYRVLFNKPGEPLDLTHADRLMAQLKAHASQD